MKKTISDRLMSKILAYGKAHIWAKGVCIALIFFVCGGRFIGRKLKANAKKLTAVAFVGILFFTSSSFTYSNHLENDLVDISMYIEGNPIELNATQESHAEMNHLLKTEYLGSHNQEDSEEQSYTLEEILAGLDQTEAVFAQMEETEEESENQTEETENLQENVSYSQIKEKAGSESATGLLTSAKTDEEEDWKLILVNKQHPIPEGYEVPLGTISGSMQCDERVIPPLLKMMQAAGEDGVNLMICSPYRKPDRQKMLFFKKVNRYMQLGYSYVDAYQLSSQAVTIPGSSEHEIGLSFDIVTPEHTALNEAFGETDAGIWLKENSYRFGFILRYPEGKEYITGIEYEPWHYRYVGVEAATTIMQEGITLEEYVDEM